MMAEVSRFASDCEVPSRELVLLLCVTVYRHWRRM